MKFLFKGNQKTTEKNPFVKENSLIIYLKKGCLVLQKEWAVWMTRQSTKLSVKNQLLVFGLFIACSVGYSVYLISMTFSDLVPNKITVTQIINPINTFQTNDATIPKSSIVSKVELDKIIRFRTYMDSLARRTSGRKIYDSIVKNRPGLLDSLAVVEKYYQSNFKKEYYGK